MNLKLVFTSACVSTLFSTTMGQPMIDRIAGNSGGQGGYGGDGGPALLCLFEEPRSLTADTSGNIYICDYVNGLIRRIDASTGIISRVAGGGLKQPATGDTATSIAIPYIEDVVADKFGNLYLADSPGSVIIRVDRATNTISIVAGTYGSSGFFGDGGPAPSALLNGPRGLYLDQIRNVLLIADGANHRIRKIDLNSDTITTVVGSGNQGNNGNGGLALNAEMYYPHEVVSDSAGNIFVTDQYAMIRKVDVNTGLINAWAGSGSLGYSDGPRLGAWFKMAYGLTFDKSFNNLYFADDGNHAIRKVDLITDMVSTVAGNGVSGFVGDGGPAASAQLNWPSGLCVNELDELIIGDTYNNVVRRISGITSFSSIHTSASIEMYPNPASDFIQIKCPTKQGKIKVVDVLGKEVWTGELEQSDQIKTDRLSNGIYFLELSLPQGVTSKKFVIHR